MKIAINASFLRKKYTGIGQVTAHYINALINTYDQRGKSLNKRENNQRDDEYILYLEEDCDMELPANFKKSILKTPWQRDDLIRKIWWEKIILPRQIKEDKCTVLFSLYQCPTILNRRTKIKHIMLVHDIIPKLFPEYLNNIRKKIYQYFTEKAIQRADRIVSVSEHTKTDLIKFLHISKKKITVNYIDIDPIFKDEKNYAEKISQAVLKKYDLKKGYIYAGAGLEKRKNLTRVIHAYKFLLKEYKDQKHDTYSLDRLYVPQLVISGKTNKRLAPLITDIEFLVKELGLESYVHIIGFVDQEDAPVLYRNARMFVFPSLYEGFGMPVLEAMNAGTPVITSKGSSLGEVTNNTVLYCDPKDVKDIAQKIKYFLEVRSQELEKKYIIPARLQAKKFCWENFTQNIRNILQKI